MTHAILHRAGTIKATERKKTQAPPPKPTFPRLSRQITFSLAAIAPFRHSLTLTRRASRCVILSQSRDPLFIAPLLFYEVMDEAIF